MTKEQSTAEALYGSHTAARDGDDVMNACKLRVGYDGRLLFAVKRLKNS